MFNKKPEQTPEPLPKNFYKVVREWSPESAAMVYTLYHYEIFHVGLYAPLIMDWEPVASSPLLSWAKRNAAHYKTEIEDE